MTYLKKNQISKLFPSLPTSGDKVKFPRSPAFHFTIGKRYLTAVLLSKNEEIRWRDSELEGKRRISIGTKNEGRYEGALKTFQNNFLDEIPLLICKNNEHGVRLSQSCYRVHGFDRDPQLGGYQIVLIEANDLNESNIRNW